MRSATKLVKNLNLNKNIVQSNVIRSSVRLVSNNTTTATTSIRSYTNITQQPSFTSLFNNNNNNNNIKYQRFYSSANDVVIKVPSMGDSISEGTVVAWTKNVGDSIRVDEVVCSIETDKVTIDINAPVSGTIVELYAKEGENVTVGNDLYKIAKGDVAPAAPKPATPTPAAPSTPTPTPTPAAAPAPKPTPTPTPAPKSTPTPTPSSAPKSTNKESSETRVKMTRIRSRTAQRLKDSQNTAAMLTTFNELDMSALMNMRKQYKDEFEKKHGVKFGFMSAFVKASTIALKEQPIVNASVEGDEIVYHNNVNINVAVSAPRGLVVPVIRNCEDLSFADIEKEIGRLSGLARTDSLAIEDSVGGTFTISNGGVFGSMFGTPIINPPQSAILGMHAIKDRPYVVNGQVVVKPIMYLALTYDHRIIDGREAVTFLKKIKDVLETPERILLEL